jgi:hypothetical protein
LNIHTSLKKRHYHSLIFCDSFGFFSAFIVKKYYVHDILELTENIIGGKNKYSVLIDDKLVFSIFFELKILPENSNN